MMKNLRYLLLSMIALLAIPAAFADGNTDEGTDPGDDITILPDPPKEDTKIRMPIRNNGLLVHYFTGMIICREWPNPDEILHIRISGFDGSVLFETVCPASNLISGIYIGHFGSFYLSITTSSGASYSGQHQCV